MAGGNPVQFASTLSGTEPDFPGIPTPVGLYAFPLVPPQQSRSPIVLLGYSLSLTASAHAANTAGVDSGGTDIELALCMDNVTYTPNTWVNQTTTYRYQNVIATCLCVPKPSPATIVSTAETYFTDSANVAASIPGGWELPLGYGLVAVCSFQDNVVPTVRPAVSIVYQLASEL